ncbi:hypothetical protein D8T49_23735 [Vibrio vulnificus]|uniref:hypothetical protein n=1 Tax=Vibrio TaxID=662 RepID=UPI001023CD95|nr:MULTISPECIES: hypothetical protein [Vibrio]MCG6332562.1 hypothetical protein [Vibrio alginolyticus]MCG6336901.1 hypothetical protein [Vibrio alginolyticus]MCG6396674.1 hypothetical protein [Vibrio alginolyticus]MCG6451352.1 hypothetical protein [Vibrio parahaemolyticus]MCU8190534.1 hypothetical protein [Vibrio vulnificus]
MEWNNKELRELVFPQLNEEKYAQFEASMASVQWKLNIALRSRDKCVNSLKSHSNYTQLELAQAAMKVLLGGASDSEACTIDTMLSDSELYLISFAHAMHSIPDILSNVAYHALDLGTYKDCPRNISLWELKKFIQKKGIYPHLLAAILDLEDCFEWIYLNAFTNVTKHQKVIGLTSSVKLVDWDNGILNVSLKGFNRNSSISFLPVRLNVFLETDYATLGALYLKIGQAINRETES